MSGYIKSQFAILELTRLRGHECRSGAQLLKPCLRGITRRTHFFVGGMNISVVTIQSPNLCLLRLRVPEVHDKTSRRTGLIRWGVDPQAYARAGRHNMTASEYHQPQLARSHRKKGSLPLPVLQTHRRTSSTP